MNPSSSPRGLIVVVLAALVLAILASLVIDWANHSRDNMPVLGKVTDFTFVSSAGDTVKASDIRGKIVVLDFIFTNCQAACPVMSSKMAQLYEYYAHSNLVRFISISVDPDRDTPEVLKDYAASHGVTDDRWIFLRGPQEEVKRVSEKVFMLPADNLPMGHSTRMVLIDEQGNIRAYFDAMTDGILPVIKTHINALARKLL